MAEKDRYLIETLLRACDVLEAFRSEGELLRLTEIASRTGLSKATAFRILHTLVHRRLIERANANQYRLGIRPPKRRPYRLGYGAQSTEFSFSRDVADGIRRAAAQEGVDLLVLDNRYSPNTAVRNADTFVRERVDLVIEFQTDEHTAPVVSSKLLDAGIPLIALEIPHPAATYYGANNYLAGLMGGRYLGRWARQNWGGAVDEVILLELPMAGALPASRLTGTLAGIREILPEIQDRQVVYLNGNGQFGRSLEAVRKRLRLMRARHVLVSAINDPSAIGALRAFEEVGRTETCAVMGQNASAEARAELRRGGTRLVGSVAYFPERYGEAVIPLAFDILRRKPVPPALFVKHQMIAPDNIDRLYPNDTLLATGDIDALLLRSG